MSNKPRKWILKHGFWLLDRVMRDESERAPWSGLIDVVVYDHDARRVVHVEHTHNVICDGGKNLMSGMLDGTITDGKIRYVAIGSGTTAEASSQTQLATEQLRKTVTNFSISGLNPGQVQTIMYVAPSEANTFTINEVGWFATATATPSINSGVMIARVVLGTPITKTSSQSVQFTRTDSIG